MKKYVLFAFIALFFVSSSVWADTAYVKLTNGGQVSWIPIKGIIDGTNIEISRSAIDSNTTGSIDLNEVWSENDGSGTQYQVTTIGEFAFYWCKGLTSVTIPNSVTSIGQGAFQTCSGLTSVTIPNSVTTIGQGAFQGCSSLTSITIPNSVTSIGQYAFYDCSGLTSVTIPNSVTTIGQGAFRGCSGLTSITIPNSVTTIGQDAFLGCSSLTSITIPNSVTTIGQSAFFFCEGLTSVTIGNGVTTIGKDAFSGCTSVTDVYCHALPNQLTWDEYRCDDFKSIRGTLCHVYDEEEWSEFEGVVNVTFVGDLMLKLEANDDNTGVVASLDNKTLDVELAERTFLTDGSWTTLCLPFDVDNFDSTPLESFIVHNNAILYKIITQNVPVLLCSSNADSWFYELVSQHMEWL